MNATRHGVLPSLRWLGLVCLVALLLTATLSSATAKPPKRDSDDAFLNQVESELKKKVTKPAPETHKPEHHEHEGHSLWELVKPRESWSTLVSGYREGIYRTPILAGALAGGLLAFLGVFIVLRRMVFASAAISQASVCGVAFAHVLHSYLGVSAFIASPPFGALFFGLTASLLFVVDPTRLGLTRESVLGLVFLLSSAVGLGLRDRIAAEGHDISQAIFGHAVSVPTEHFHTIVWLVAVLGPLLLLARHSLMVVAFDKTSAKVQRLPVRSLEAFLFLSIGCAIAICTKILGALPVFAYSVLPAMGALSYSKRPGVVFTLAVIFGSISGAGGYALATLFGYPVGASQTTLAALLALSGALVHLLTQRRGRAAAPALAHK